MKQFKLMLGDNIESLKKIPDNSIDSVVSDPPYALTPSKGAKAGFMGKKWDAEVPSVEFWKEVYRVLKPGGHVLSFGGTRTYHRMVVNIEDAGFEIRDQIMWIYGSGFPKSHNIGKAVDKIEGNERTGGEVRTRIIDGNSYGSTDMRWDVEPSKGTSPHEGWGSSLKPANEPICVARKPLSEKTIAENVLKWGTGGINIDGCRIEGVYGSGENEIIEGKHVSIFNDGDKSLSGHKERIQVSNSEGRFPANIIFDESAAEMLDEQSGIIKSSIRKPTGKNKDDYNSNIAGGAFGIDITERGHNDSGGASRFFYIPKVGKKERNMGLDGFEDKPSYMVENGSKTSGLNGKSYERNTVAKNSHPTVKPVQLMAYLCRLVTPPNGIVLDPFMGSGSTGISACLEGFRFVGMEQEKSYFDIATARIENYDKYREFLDKKKKKDTKKD